MNWIVPALLAALFAGLVPVWGKLGLKAADPTIATVARAFVMFLMVFAVLLCQGKAELLFKLTGREWIPVILSGVCGGISWLFYFEALKLGPASQVASLDKLSLAVTIALAAMFLGEALSWKVALGGALICLGAFITTQQ